MLSTYPACFFKEENGYTVIFPDLDNLSTCGDTLEEASRMAVDCLAGYLFWLTKDDEAFPSPSSVGTISCKDVAANIDESYFYTEAFVNVITVDVEEYAKAHFNKSVKKTLSIPAWMNNEALALGVNFSQVLQEALMQILRANRPCKPK